MMVPIPQPAAGSGWVRDSASAFRNVRGASQSARIAMSRTARKWRRASSTGLDAAVGTLTGACWAVTVMPSLPAIVPVLLYWPTLPVVPPATWPLSVNWPPDTSRSWPTLPANVTWPPAAARSSLISAVIVTSPPATRTSRLTRPLTVTRPPAASTSPFTGPSTSTVPPAITMSPLIVPLDATCPPNTYTSWSTVSPDAMVTCDPVRSLPPSCSPWASTTPIVRRANNTASPNAAPTSRILPLIVPPPFSTIAHPRGVRIAESRVACSRSHVCRPMKPVRSESWARSVYLSTNIRCAKRRGTPGGSTMAAVQSKPNITGLTTVAVPVSNQDRAVEFYVGKLGFQKRMDVPLSGTDRWIEVAPADGSTTIALVP